MFTEYLSNFSENLSSFRSFQAMLHHFKVLKNKNISKQFQAIASNFKQLSALFMQGPGNFKQF